MYKLLSRGLLSISLCCCGLGVGYGQETSAAKPTIAVMYLLNNALANKEHMAPLERGLTDMLITELSKVEALRVVERAQLDQLLDEMSLGRSGAIRLENMQKMGQLLGAETLLLGSFSTDLSGKRLRIDARIVETQTGLTLKAEEVTDKTKSIFQMVAKLVEKIAKDLDIKLTQEDRKRLDKRENKSYQAALLYYKRLDHEDRQENDSALEMYYKALEYNPDYGKVKRRIEAIKTNQREGE